ncbi:MAG: hypothetical protein ACREH5_08375 [Candidatus Omnitrophota bacterium]
MRALKDRYGFLFWLRWILWFAGSFVVAAAAWTAGMKWAFGPIEGAELTMTWCVAVFGSWFLLVIPFMRKKEQIWKRMNDDQEKAVDAWLFGMGSFIGLLIASCLIWSVILRGEIRSAAGFELRWLKGVFVSWLIILFPFLIFMYRQADRIFKTAVLRQTYAPRFKSVAVDRAKRLLPDEVSLKLRAVAPTLRQGHVVTAHLKDGRRVPDVFILNNREILGIYDRPELDFEGGEVLDIEVMSLDKLPAYEEAKWLRLDGLA